MMRTSATTAAKARVEPPEPMDAADIVIGKDLLELLTSAMYVEPMTVYREYIQNAADSIDLARKQGLLVDDAPGRVEIDIDPASRTVSIIDHGHGIAWADFAKRLTALGASTKRGSHSRGFRGVGRLAGLGYAQELVFRSRIAGEDRVSEMRWDCRKLRSLLRNQDETDLSTLVAGIVGVTRIDGAGWPDRFFQAEMRQIVRLKADRLLDPTAIADYLGQVAPVPFAPEFRFGAAIRQQLEGSVALSDLDISITGRAEPVHRPHANAFAIDDDTKAEFTEIEFFDVPGSDGGLAAIGWLLHHDYVGAIPAAARLKGLRIRAGNVQVGDTNLLEELFPEPRFNGWSVGEVHILDARIVPNGRRDHFEQNSHFNNLLNHLGPVTRDIARRCRTGSVRRKLLKDFESQRAAGMERLAILEQGAVGTARRDEVVQEARQARAQMSKVVPAPALLDADRAKLQEQLDLFDAQLESASDAYDHSEPLAGMPEEKRVMYEHFFDLIYACSSNRIAAKSLVDKILEKLA